jgi:hypothetical protein
MKNKNRKANKGKKDKDDETKASEEGKDEDTAQELTTGSEMGEKKQSGKKEYEKGEKGVGETVPQEVVDALKAPATLVTPVAGPEPLLPIATKISQLSLSSFKRPMFKRRQPKMISRYQIDQSPMSGAALFRRPSGVWKIDPFKNHEEFARARIRLACTIFEEMASMTVPLPKENVASRVNQTTPSAAGMDIVANARSSDSKTLDDGDKALEIADKAFGFVNKPVNGMVRINTMNGPQDIQIAQGLLESFVVLDQADVNLSVEAERMTYEEYGYDVASYIEYLRLFNMSKSVMDYYDAAAIRKKAVSIEYNILNIPQFNYNWRNYGDIFLEFRSLFLNMIGTEIKMKLDPLLSQCASPHLDATLTKHLNIGFKANEISRAKKEFVAGNDQNLFMRIVMTTVMARRVRLYDGATDMDYSLARVTDIVLRRILTTMRNWNPNTVKRDQIYLIIHLFRIFDQNASQHPQLYSEGYWSGIQQPIASYFTIVDLNEMQGVMRLFFEVDEMGSGYLGAGLNPGSTKKRPRAAERFTVEETIEPFAQVGYEPSYNPPVPVQITRAIGAITEMRSKLRRIASGNIEIQGIIYCFNMIMDVINELRWYAQLMESINYFYCLSSLAAPWTDDTSKRRQYVKTPFQTSQADVIVNQQVFNSSYVDQHFEEVITEHIKTTSMVALLLSYRWSDMYMVYANLKPDVELVMKSIALNYDLIKLSGHRYITQKHAPEEWSNSEVLRTAIDMWDSPLKPAFLSMVEKKQNAGYISMAGVDYFKKMYDLIDEYIDTDTIAHGYAPFFLWANRAILPETAISGLSWQNIAGEIGEVIEVTVDTLKNRPKAKYLLANQGIFKINVPLMVDYPMANDCRTQSNYDSMEYGQRPFDYDVESATYRYTVGKFKIMAIFDNERYRYRLNVLTGNSNTSIVGFPYVMKSTEEVTSYFRSYNVFGTIVSFDEFEPEFFDSRMSSIFDAC